MQEGHRRSGDVSVVVRRAPGVLVAVLVSVAVLVLGASTTRMPNCELVDGFEN
jgi:hypothetical protein